MKRTTDGPIGTRSALRMSGTKAENRVPAWARRRHFLASSQSRLAYQDVEALQQHGVDAQEVGEDDRRSLLLHCCCTNSALDADLVPIRIRNWLRSEIAPKLAPE